jgi:hypothetical protein
MYPTFDSFHVVSFLSFYLKKVPNLSYSQECSSNSTNCVILKPTRLNPTLIQGFVIWSFIFVLFPTICAIFNLPFQSLVQVPIRELRVCKFKFHVCFVSNNPFTIFVYHPTIYKVPIRDLGFVILEFHICFVLAMHLQLEPIIPKFGRFPTLF